MTTVTEVTGVGGRVSMWSEVKDGIAKGPAIYIDDRDGGMTLEAMWTDEDGVVVSLVMRGPCVLTKGFLARIRAATDHLLSLDPPMVGAVCKGEK